MRKRLQNLMLVTSLIFSFSVGQAVAAAPGSHYISFGTDAGGGSYTMMASAINSVLHDVLPQISINLETTSGGGVGNIRKLGANEIELGISTSSSAYEAATGTGDFTNEKYNNIRILLAGSATPVYAWVPSGSPYKSVADLKGARIGVNSAANASTFAPAFLAAHGLGKGDYEIIQMSGTNLSDALKDGGIDSIVSTAAVPYAIITELANTGNGGYFLKTDAAALQQVANSSPYWVNYTIPANTFPKQPEDFVSIAVMANIYTSADVSDEITYALTKSIVENVEKIGAIYDGSSTFTLKNQKGFFVNGLDKAVPPISEGAKKYLMEHGLK